jgi:putative transposase
MVAFELATMLLAVWYWLRVLFSFTTQVRQTKACPKGYRQIKPAITQHHCSRKPDWVLAELVRLKAHMPDAGCRTLALTFNRLFVSRQMSVCKSTAHKLLRNQAYAVLLARRAIRSKVPYPVAVNDTWALDMTGRADTAGLAHTIMGIVDHGSRRTLMLQAIPSKSSWQLLSWLCLTIDQFGKPRALRTDNERCFSSAVFTWGLKLLGVRHQRIDRGCPWQNGRIERLFGTLKLCLKRVQFDSASALDGLLDDFRCWYNHIRPHQNLDGLTPTEAWNGVDVLHPPTPPAEIRFYQTWDGLLCGFYMRR